MGLVEVPARGVVAEWNVMDGVGRIELADGTRLRFGRACCVQFEPVEGIDVTVEAVEAHPLGGWRASRIVPTSLDQVDELLEARDAQRGVRGSLHLEPEEALALAQQMGLLSIELCEPVGSRVTLRSVFARSGAPGLLEFSPSPSVRIDGHTFPLTVSDAPGRSRIMLCHGPFSFRREAAAIARTPGEPFDVWQGWGLCAATRLALALAALGQSVIVHAAGDLELSAAEWIRLAGDPLREQCRPFRAYVSLVATDRDSIETRGMQVWALPDVTARAAHADAARDACLVACATMVHAAAPLPTDASLYVPPNAEVGPYPLTFDPFRPAPGTQRWRVGAVDAERLTLNAD
jgi:hypothetical protein